MWLSGIVFKAPLVQINQIISKTRFRADEIPPNKENIATITITVNDQGNTGFSPKGGLKNVKLELKVNVKCPCDGRIQFECCDNSCRCRVRVVPRRVF